MKQKMKFGIKILLLIGFVISLTISCNDQWDKHYNTYPETVNQNMWDAMQSDPQIADFVQIIKDFELDTLFASDIVYTVFVPNNEALASFESEKGDVTNLIVRYNIATHFINGASIKVKRLVQTLTEKFALFEQFGGSIAVDGLEITAESPLYLNGKYYTMEQLNEPKPNLYEYYKFTNPVLSDFIDKQDSIELDPLSQPTGFDEYGNTVYDTILKLRNIFEEEYFQVKQEFRSYAATVVFPKAEDYNKALDVVAEDLGGLYTSHEDVPLKWQEEVLMPYLITQGIFLNRLEPEEFIEEYTTDTTAIFKMVNILGDSVVVDYTPTDKAYCSNGFAYNYLNFEIPDSLYSGDSRMEGEALLMSKGFNKFVWAEGVTYKSDVNIEPLGEVSFGFASNDSLMKVNFDKGYNGEFSLEFEGPDLFPRKYLMVVRTTRTLGGAYDIYVNDQKVGDIDYYDYVMYQGYYESADGVTLYAPEKGGFVYFDVIVENIVEYGRPKIKFEYTGPSYQVQYNGIGIDYIEFKVFQ